MGKEYSCQYWVDMMLELTIKILQQPKKKGNVFQGGILEYSPKMEKKQKISVKK